ncbi:non-functional pseudokinase ZED1-like [Coffea arabica]|uniref:Non-functional pseudokinase ZED1-like n=1 Tax=Coffea arabica TaxID=13443 RepID=A0A6P6UVV5_COFAR|nr:non-functional pseudokinase ZED1-like [Coffea arabica]
MDKMKRAFAVLRPKLRKEREKRLFCFYKNGGLVLEDLIASFGARYELPVRSFTAEEIIRATRNFSEQVRQTKMGDMFTGNMGKRLVLVQFYNGLGKDSRWNENASNRIIRDIVMSSQMRHLKNVLQLIGCCLEFEHPAMVYCYATGTEFLVDCLNLPADDGKEILSWRSRIKIASDVANVLVYLHTAFSTPVIFGNLTIDKVIIDQFGDAKLFDFGLSISLPPGELKVENQLRWADVYTDPQCFKSYFVTQKTDVYSLGVLMLMLVTGETDTVMYHTGIKRLIHIRKHVKGYLDNDQLNQIVDPKIMEEVGDNCVHELEQQVLAFLDLAFRCTEHERTSRPDMIDAAKELRQMEKSVYRC